jgi:hypothetical protein
MRELKQYGAVKSNKGTANMISSPPGRKLKGEAFHSPHIFGSSAQLSLPQVLLQCGIVWNPIFGILVADKGHKAQFKHFSCHPTD